MAKIYVSSTYLDLQEHRAQVERVIRRMGHEDVAMEYYVAEDQRPVAKCLADVAACDVYVGIFAWRYGWGPKENNPKELSITEMEYQEADAAKKPCLIFLLSDDAPWPRKQMDKDTTKIEALRNIASAHHTADYFTTPDELARKVAEAIHKWEKEHGYIPIASPIPEYNLDAYFAALKKRYGVLALEGLTPPQKEEYLQIQLRSVFVEQNVRENPPPIELPKEVWEKLQREKDIHPEDLPSGITLDDVRKAREAYYEKPSRPVLDVLTDSRYQHTTILGDPGSGKSTLARYVMLSLIEGAPTPALPRPFYERAGEGVLPLLIELRSYAGLCADGNCTTFLEFLDYLGKTEGWALTQSALHNHLKNDGRAVVIFDGLDEIFDPEQRERITRQIVGFCGDYPKARVIVTSRVIGYRRKILTDAGFTHFTLQDLDEKQVATFVSRWYDLAMSDRPDEAKERRERILKSFKESVSIRALAGNPMLLTIMAIIGKHQELPRERWKLYDHAASVLIQHWDVNKHLKDARIDADFIGEDDKKELLRRLAFRMQSGEGGLAGNYIHREQLQTEFEDYLRERYAQAPDRAVTIARAIIDQFRERNFILSLYGANLYGFVHRAFLEFFCASAFVWKFEKTKELTIDQLKTDVYGKHWEDQIWREVLRLIWDMIDQRFVREIIEYLTKSAYRIPDEYIYEMLPQDVLSALQGLRLPYPSGSAFAEVLRAFTGAIEARGSRNIGHASRVARFAVEVAREMSWTNQQLEFAELGALLHDIGEIGVPEMILLKPGPLTEDEFAVLKQHPVFGAKVLENAASFRPILPYVLYHHERYDGHGYPFGLVGKEIPVEGRLIAVVDAFDAMISDRPYRRGLSLDEAINELSRNRGQMFDPDIVDALIRAVQKEKPTWMFRTEE